MDICFLFLKTVTEAGVNSWLWHHFKELWLSPKELGSRSLIPVSAWDGNIVSLKHSHSSLKWLSDRQGGTQAVMTNRQQCVKLKQLLQGDCRVPSWAYVCSLSPEKRKHFPHLHYDGKLLRGLSLDDEKRLGNYQYMPALLWQGATGHRWRQATRECLRWTFHFTIFILFPP